MDVERVPALGGAALSDCIRTNSLGFYKLNGKRAFDVVFGVLILAATWPLLALLILVVACDGGSPVFAHTRIGQGGRRFGCLKLRTMVPDAEARLSELLASDPALADEWQRTRKLANDPRVTRLGRFLRRTSLDELPQIINVIRGEMSLVGPRPVTAEELARYGSCADAYMSVRPGLTGRWQVMGRNDISFPERVLLDQAYTREMSFLEDLKIVLLTTRTVLAADGR